MIILFIIIACIFILLHNYHSQSHKKYKKIHINDLLKQLKTGDIILFRHSDAYLTTTMGFGDEISHIGIVIEKNNKLYVCETIGLGEYYETKLQRKIHIKKLDKLNDKLYVRCAPLYERLSKYNGYICVKLLNKQLDQRRYNNMIKYYESNWDMPFCDISIKNNIMKIITCFFKLDYLVNNNAKCVFCSSFILGALKEINIIDDDLQSNFCYKPNDIRKLLETCKYKDSYKYGKCLEIIFSDDQ